MFIVVVVWSPGALLWHLCGWLGPWFWGISSANVRPLWPTATYDCPQRVHNPSTPANRSQSVLSTVLRTLDDGHHGYSTPSVSRRRSHPHRPAVAAVSTHLYCFGIMRIDGCPDTPTATQMWHHQATSMHRMDILWECHPQCRSTVISIIVRPP